MSILAEKGEWPTEQLPASWAWVDFDEFWADYTDAKRKIPQNSYLVTGEFPVVDQGAELIGGFTDDSSKRSHAPLPAVVFGDHTRVVKYIDRPFVQGADGVRVLCARAGVEPMFAFHALQCVNLPDKGYSRHFKFLKVTSFPIAPVPEQRRIVAKIDSLSAKSKRARDQLDHIHQLVEKYKQAILAAAFRGDLTREWRTLHKVQFKYSTMDISGLANVVTGSTPPTKDKARFFGGSIPFFKPTDLDIGYHVVNARETSDGRRRSCISPSAAILGLGDVHRSDHRENRPRSRCMLHQPAD